MAQMTRYTVSKTFYDLCLEELPALRNNKAYRRMFQYLCFGGFRDKDTGRLIISRDILASIEGKEELAKQNNYSADVFLKGFKRDVLPDFAYSRFNASERKARVVIDRGLPKRIETALFEELRKSYHENGRVYFENGTKYSDKKERAERNEIKGRANMFQAHSIASQTVLDYMNTLAPNLFTAIVERNHADALQKASELQSEEAFIHNARVLRSIRSQVQPFYQPSDHTDRIFPLNESILLLSKEVRQTLTRGWVEFDIKNAHLAINAYLWQAPTVMKFLQTGKSFWVEMIVDTYNMRMTEEVKKFFKQALYSICYGKQVRHIKADFTKEGIDYRLFLEHEVMKDLLRARKEYIEGIERAGGAYTCFNVWLSLEEYEISSILSILAQAIELQLLLPLVEVVMRNREVSITLWQHDGFTANIIQSEQEFWIDRLKKVFRENCKNVDIVTELEYKEL